MTGTFTPKEWLKMGKMVAAIWDVDIDKVKLFETTETFTNIQFPVLDHKYGPVWTAGVTERPTFTTEIISIDRWLIPWKIQAGYSTRFNLLVWRRNK